MASFTKRGNGWQARVSWVDTFGKRHFKNKQGFKTKSLAKRWAVENEEQLNKGIEISKESTLASYYWQWIKTYKENKVASITYKRYVFTGKALESFFKQTNIKRVTRQQYQEFINNYGSNHAPDTVKKVNSIIRACVKSAILDGYLVKDFTQQVSLTSNPSKVLKVDYLSINEIKKLRSAVVQGIKNRPGFTSRYMILTAIYTGMRLSEIQALTWNDINFVKQTISITKSWDASIKKFKPTKNKSSERTIKVNKILLEYLQVLKQHATSNLVFLNQYQTIPTSEAVNKTLRGLLDNLNIHRRNFHFHSLRHSHVALLLANGIDIYAISKRLGHSNTATTSKVYAYLIDEYKSKTDNQIISALSDL